MYVVIVEVENGDDHHRHVYGFDDKRESAEKWVKEQEELDEIHNPDYMIVRYEICEVEFDGVEGE